MLQRWLRWAVARGEPRVFRRQRVLLQHSGAAEAQSRFETVAVGVANDVQSRIRAYGDVACTRCVGCSTPRTEVDPRRIPPVRTGDLAGRSLPGVTNISFTLSVPPGRSSSSNVRCAAESSPLVKGLPKIRHQAPGRAPEYMVLIYSSPWARTSCLGARPERRCLAPLGCRSRARLR